MRAIPIIVFLEITLFSWGCSTKPSSELDAMTRDVIKSKTGVEIIVQPLEEKSDK